ncbi:MAG TPA: FAD-dependent oxidoreductase, partial [Trebonia sp.]|nr:FAD-dependent oxidoreductase [Trebonia sp.]
AGSGLEEVRPAAVLLATGCRERPRAARLVPGDRPAGVLTTGELQQRVYLGGERLPGRAVVVGAEHVSFSAAVTLVHAGARVVALVTEHARHQSYAAFRLGAALRWGIPVWTSSTVTRVTGADGRLASVDITGMDGRPPRTVECDWLVFTGDWIPDHELARTSGLTMDPGTLGPAIDTSLATSAPAVFAAGNLIHAAETADVAALSGRHAAGRIAAYLAAPASAASTSSAASASLAGARVPVVAEPPLQWISPNAITTDGTPPPAGRFVLRSADLRKQARLEARQDGRLLARSRRLRLIPGRPVYLRARWLAAVEPDGGPVRVGVAGITGLAGSGRSRGGQQEAGGQAAVRPPGLGQVGHLGRGGQVIKAVADPDRVAQGEVVDAEQVGSLERDEQRALDGPRADSLDGGEPADHLLVGQVTQRGLGQVPVAEPLGQVKDGAGLAVG